MLRDLSPVVHQYDFNLYRVPMRKDKNSYTLYVDDNFSRVFDEDTLPDEVKTNTAMILARGQDPLMHDHDVTPLMIMTTTKDHDFRDIGWQVSDIWFCIILPYKILMGLRGSHQRD